MAKRYSGDLQISVTYDDHNFYRTSISQGGKKLWSGTVKPAPAGFGSGVAYDSPQAYDEIAASALAFADDEVGGIGDHADYDENLTGYLIQRTPPTRTSSHATRRSQTGKKPRIMVRKIGGRWQPVNVRGMIVRGAVYNTDGSGYSTRQGATEAAKMFRQLGTRA